ncbi:MAG: electron transfer flavoprotein subunit alpha/FixB family protein [Chloroflexi bacterium]|nr:electron transfer flavoprotein subunit alpha/FixB family protein [Chloroflexota bacterium]
MTESSGVLICGELAGGKPSSITYELLGAGRRLADALGEKLNALLIGDGIGDVAGELIAWGADTVYVADDPLLKDYQPEPYAAAIKKACQKTSPEVLLLGQTSVGRDLAPRLAFALGTGLAMDCIELTVDPATRLVTLVRPVYGGNALAAFLCEKTRPQMATVRAKAMSPVEPDGSRKGEVVKLEVQVDAASIRVRYVETVKQEAEGIRLEEAAVVVSGGRGMGGAENFAMLEALAKTLKGAVGGSRPACDSGWLPSTQQVGLTGKIVAPDLYIAVGISGSSQHLAGCSGSKHVVAINKDPEANIFKVAEFGVIGDYKQALPALIKKCGELVAG